MKWRTADTPAPRLPQLDAVRGLALLLILIYHFKLWFSDALGAQPLLARLGWLFSLSWTGIELFFVLSGFLIGGVVLDNRDAKNFFRVFYVRRCARILPPYLVLLGLFFAVVHLAPPPRGPGLELLLAQQFPFWVYPAFVQNLFMAAAGAIAPPLWLAPTWSLAIEEQFYLILPVLLRTCPARIVPHVLVALIAIAPLSRILAYFVLHSSWVAVYVLLPCRMDALLLGVLGAWAVRQPDLWEWISGRRHRLIGPFVCLAAIVAGLSWAEYDFTAPAIVAAGYTSLALFYLFFIMIVVRTAQPWVRAGYALAPLRLLGKISYSVYLLHLPALGLLGIFVWGKAPWEPGATPGSWWLLPVSTLALVLALGALSWRFVERPILALGYRLQYVRDLGEGERTGLPAVPPTSGDQATRKPA